MKTSELYGPWEVEGYQVEIDLQGRASLAASREGNRLKSFPQAVRDSGDMAWLRLALEAAQNHQRHLRTLLEGSMTEAIPLPAEDLAWLALDPAGRIMLEGLLVDIDGVVGRPVLSDWLLESQSGDLYRLGAPAVVAHPVKLKLAGTLERWDNWLNRSWVTQPFKQIRREIFFPNERERETRTYTNRLAGDCIRWDQGRAILEGRGWYRVTKTGAERVFRKAKLTAYLEFRTPATRGFEKDQVLTGRIFFLPVGQQVVNRGNPGIPLDRVPPVLFSETLRDARLACTVAGRNTPTE